MGQRRRIMGSVLWLSYMLVMDTGCNSTSGAECPEGEVFVDGMCRLACVEGGCPVGQVCQEGYCAKAFVSDPPQILGSAPSSPANSTQPLLTGTAEANTTIRIYTHPECAGDPVTTGSVRDFGSVGLQVVVSPNSTTTFYATAEGPGQLVSDCSAQAFTYVEDSTPPLEPTIQGLTPASPANDNHPAIQGAAEPDTAVSIHTDSSCNFGEVARGSASDFTSPGFTLTVDNDTETTFHVLVTDEAGNSTCSTSSATYIEDSTPPTFAGLASSRNLSKQEVELSWQAASDTITPEGEIVYDVCASTLDGGCAPFSITQSISGATTVSVTGLAAETRHFFVVRARDMAGNRDENTVQGTADTCAPGFGLDPDTCTWQGVVRDPSFREPDVWTLHGLARINMGASGNNAPGEADLSKAALCNFDGVSQQLLMPSFADVGPLELTVAQRRVNADPQGGIAPYGGFALDGKWQPLGYAYDSSYSDISTCLGELAYDGWVELRLGPASAYGCTWPEDYSLCFDDVRIGQAPANECPAVGELVNGDFQADMTGWTSFLPSSGAALTLVDQGGGDKALQLELQLKCVFVSAAASVSVPTSSTMEKPALELTYAGTDERLMSLKLGGRPWVTLAGMGNEVTTHICLPANTKGMAPKLTFSLDAPPGYCSDPYVSTFVLDDLAVVSESSCPADANIVDGGFEAVNIAGVSSGWYFTPSHAEAPKPFSIEVDETLAHTGMALLRIDLQDNSDYAYAGTWVALPGAGATGGPAITFWYKAPDLTDVMARAQVNGTERLVPLAEAEDWTQETVCFDPAREGQMVYFQFYAQLSCTDCPASPRSLFVDDVEVGTSASCPSE